MALLPSTAGAQTGQTSKTSKTSKTGKTGKTGINRNFVDAGEAAKRQEAHNDFFLSSAAGQPAQILDLQTSPYALAERPDGLDYQVFSAIGYGVATSMMILGPRTDADGHRRVVIIDTLEDFSSGKEVAGDYLALYNRLLGTDLAKLPIDAILYTHNHVDHTGGVLGYLSMADKEPCPPQDPSVRGLGGKYLARRQCLEILSQEKVVDAVVNTSTVSGQIIQARSSYMYGLQLKNRLSPPPDPQPLGRAITNGIGPYFSRGIAGFRLPSRTFADEMWLSAAGVEMQLIYVPSETDDELAVFVPDALNGVQPAAGQATSGLLFSAEVIQGPAFPNLYSLRGTQYRSPATWYQSVDKLRQYDSWCMVPSHGPPLCHRDNIQRLLTNFRDAIQFTHDQTVRLMNLGYKPDQLAERVRVPDVLLDDLESIEPWPNAPGDTTMRGPVQPEDYLLPFYGSVAQGVRETYSGYVGWFDGDPVNLEPVPPQEAAKRLAATMAAGQDPVSAARQALSQGEYQWAAELATIAIEADPSNVDARQAKAQAFMALSERALNPNWSDWYATAANELLDQPGTCFLPFVQVGLISPVTQAAVPLENLVESLSLSLEGQKAAEAGVRETLGLWIQPTRQDFGVEGFTVELRHGIAEIGPFKGTESDLVAASDLALSLSQDTLDELLLAQAFQPGEIGPILESGQIEILEGTQQEIQTFF
ncbi:MAG: MBL fold metallo-hydrolase, partial [Acidobacteria bacterium]|nr:MBL fold metallo-hydrolase [Acidobacteriota bacterium]